MRESLTRRGSTKLRTDQYQEARCSLLGYDLKYLTIEGASVPKRFLQVHYQVAVETEGYDAGAKILFNFFKKELPRYLTPELHPVGRKIIETCLANGTIEAYNDIIPLNYSYNFPQIGEV
jgi:hypothetical protein